MDSGDDEPSSKTNWTTFAYAAGTILVGFLGVPLSFAGIVLASSAATAIGKLTGAGCMLLAIAIQPFAWKRRAVGAALLLAASACLGTVVAARSPADPSASTAVRLVGRAPSSLSLARWVSEIDQLFVGSTLLTWFADEPANEMERLRTDVRSVYREFDDDFRSVPSLLDDAVANECSGRSFVWGEAESAPDGDAIGRSLLFVHGYGGSWTGYLRVVRPIATTLGARIVQPSCGIGLWKTEHELATFERFLTEESAPHGQLHLVALSNGGLAVSRRLEAVLVHATSLVLVSPGFDLEAIERIPEVSRRIPILVLHGDADTRIPLAHVEAGIRRLRRLHLDVRLRVLEGADHYAFFHERVAVRREIADFLADVARPGAR